MAFEGRTRSAPVPTERRWLEDYPGLRRAQAECARPRSEDELRGLLRWAGSEGRTVTLRGGGQCLHGQSVGDDVVIDLSALDRIEVDLAKGTLTAGAGARWADVHAAVPRGWVLPNLVTTGAASVGGTLVADAASRFSSAFGREIEGVVRVRLMTADGAILECDRQGPHAELFRALPGSVGLLGVALSVEHRLIDARHLAAQDGSLRVRTVARKHPDARGLFADLALELSAPPSTRNPRGAYALLVPGGGALLFHSTYTGAPRARRMMNHRRRDPMRGLVERILHVPALNRALWRVIFEQYYGDGDHFVDAAEDFAFFMDAGTAARAQAAQLGLALGALVQQVIELPFDAGPGAQDRASALALGFERLCRVHDVQPIGCDVVAVRGAAGAHALRFSTAVPIARAEDEDRARTLLAAQAALAAEHGGRVLVGKGVYADARTLAETSREALAALARLEARWDPSRLFGGPFHAQVLRPAMALATSSPRSVVAPRLEKTA
ncbi:MAG: FAD-dependent oxidoreductase [Sandaracinus sp.]